MSQIIVVCTNCRQKLRVDESKVGSKLRCPSCKNVFLTSANVPAPPPPVQDYSPDPTPKDEMYCRNCGHALSPSAAMCTGCGMRPLDGVNFCPRCKSATLPQAVGCITCGISLVDRIDNAGVRPGSVTAIGTMLIVGGAWSLLAALVMIWFCIGIYNLVAGIISLIAGIKVLSNGKGSLGSARTAAIMLIICVIDLDVVAMTLGIISLVLLSNEKCRRFLS